MARTIDPDFLNKIREIRCLACGAFPAEAHHILPRSQGGGDDWYNVIPLCANHHTQNGVGHAWHRGKISFLKNYPHVLDHIQKLGWELFNEKLMRDKNATL